MAKTALRGPGSQQKPAPHWFSRRHETSTAHNAAVEHYQTRQARRAEERAELRARNSQTCELPGCSLTRAEHATHDAEPTRWHPGHQFVEPADLSTQDEIAGKTAV